MAMLNTLPLPDNLVWDNEQDFKPWAFSKQRAVNGALNVQAVALHYGRPIKLTGSWISRSELEQLQALESEPLVPRTLTLASQTFTVLFDLEAGGIEARPLFKCTVATPDDLFDLTLNFITVEPV